jgi:molybdenum cofactor cytidylyltransferase
MYEVDVILLAAGLSSRMRPRNKLLLEVRGTPVIRRMVETYADAVDGPIRVVTGHMADEVRASLHGLAVHFVHNADFERGQQGSVLLGLAEPCEAKATLIGLGDQPDLRSGDVKALIAAHRAGAPGKITVPCYQGHRGNPIVLPRERRTEILSDPSKPTCRGFIDAHPEAVQMLEMSSAAFTRDIDTPEAFRDFLTRDMG